MEKSMSTLIIHDVDTDMLEQQRLVLAEMMVEWGAHSVLAMTDERRGALDGILLMLDAWSDEQLRLNKLVDRMNEVMRPFVGRDYTTEARGEIMEIIQEAIQHNMPEPTITVEPGEDTMNVEIHDVLKPVEEVDRDGPYEKYVPWTHMTLSEKLRYVVSNDYTIDGMVCNSAGNLMMDAAQELEDLESWKDEVMKDKCTVLQNLGMHKKIDSICARLYIARHIACDSELVGECLNELDEFYKQGPTQNC
jgi:hypothetical protein